jgi:hypothetical protein
MTTLGRVIALLIAGLVSVMCPACTSDSSSSPTSLPTPSSSAASPSTRPSPAGHVPPPPKIGQCRDTPASHLGDNDWVDTTPVVDCSKPHTLETVEVIKPVEKLTLALAKQLAGSCGGSSSARGYLGISYPAVRTLAFPVVYWPSREQRAAGQNWLRCDAGVNATTHGGPPLVRQTGSLHGALLSDPVRFQVCLDQVPDPARDQPLTSCTKPHRTEVLPDFLTLNVQRYPSAATLDRKGHSGCARLLGHRQDLGSLVITSSWQPSRADWSKGDTLGGLCWIHRTSGLLPPLR